MQTIGSTGIISVAKRITVRNWMGQTTVQLMNQWFYHFARNDGSTKLEMYPALHLTTVSDVATRSAIYRLWQRERRNDGSWQVLAGEVTSSTRPAQRLPVAHCRLGRPSETRQLIVCSGENCCLYKWHDLTALELWLSRKGGPNFFPLPFFTVQFFLCSVEHCAPSFWLPRRHGLGWDQRQCHRLLSSGLVRLKFV